MRRCARVGGLKDESRTKRLRGRDLGGAGASASPFPFPLPLPSVGGGSEHSTVNAAPELRWSSSACAKKPSRSSSLAPFRPPGGGAGAFVYAEGGGGLVGGGIAGAELLELEFSGDDFELAARRRKYIPR